MKASPFSKSYHRLRLIFSSYDDQGRQVPTIRVGLDCITSANEGWWGHRRVQNNRALGYEISMNVYWMDLLGVAVFAISGCLAAGRKGLDWVGVMALAVVTSIGGGTIRDLLLNREAVFWIADPTYLWVILATSVVTLFYVRFFKPPMKALLIADALGLALFAILGAQIAEAEGVATPIVVVMGVLTGCAGGVIRDVLSGEIPLLFRPTEPLYSVAALAGVLMYVLLQALDMGSMVATFAGIALVSALRFMAIFWNLKLPAFHLSDDG